MDAGVTELLRMVQDQRAKQALILMAEMVESLEQRLRVAEAAVERHEDALKNIRQMGAPERRGGSSGFSIG